MKLFVCLVLLAAVVAQDEMKGKKGKKGKNKDREGRDGMMDWMDETKRAIDEGINSILDSSTGSGFIADIDGFLSDDLRDSVCFDATTRCTESMYLGCSCTTAFQELGEECSQFPCKIWNFIFNEMSGILEDFRDEVYSVEDATELLFERVFNPLNEMICECNPRIHDAAFKCIANYDGDILTETGMDTVYNAVVGLLDLDSLKNVFVAVSNANCLSVDGEVCYETYANSWMTWAQYWDNTIDESYDDECDDACQSFRRIGREFERYISAFSEGGKNSFRKIVYAYIAMNKKFFCSPRCQESVANDFYSCCNVEGLRIMQESDFGANVIRVAENMLGFFAEMGEGGTMDFDKQAMKKYFAMFDLAKFCKPLPGRQPNFYQQKVDQRDRKSVV